MPRHGTFNEGMTQFPLEEQVEEFCSLLRLGTYVKTACQYTGLKHRTVYDWLNEAERDDARPWVEQFARRVHEARAHAQVANLQVIQKAAANGTWQASAWYLERSAPDQWGLRARHELEVTVRPDPRSARERLSDALDALALEMHQDAIEATATED